MSVLQAIGEFGQGFSQGTGQGLDLYQRFQEIRDQGKKRQKQSDIENAVIDMHKSGKADKDPIGFANSVAELYRGQGDLDGYQKWTDAANSARDLKMQKLGVDAFAAAQVNPAAAVPLVNEMFKTYGNNNSIDLQQSPTGSRLVMNIGGKAVTKDYTPEQADELAFQLLQMVEPYAMKPEQAGQLRVARATQEAQQKYQEGRLANEKELIPSQIGENVAQAQSALASAAASGASAEYNRSRTATEEATRQGQIDTVAANLDLIRRKTETEGRTPEPYDPLGAAVDASTPAPKAGGDELGMEGPTMTPPVEDRGFQRQLGIQLKSAGLNDQEAFAATSEIVRLTPEQIATVGKISTDPATGKGVFTLPSGQKIQATPAIAAAVMRVGAAAKAAGVGVE